MPEPLRRDQYDAAWQALHDQLTPESHEYLTFHKERHWETFSKVAALVHDRPHPKVLEVGVSPFICLYPKLLPAVHLTTVDRPPQMFGMTEETALEWGSSRHYGVDLAKTALSPMLGKPPLGLYDVIVFCEILEHLPISAVQLFEELFSVLERDGFCYITTPNFFDFIRLRKMLTRTNPQDPFQARDADKWAATHFREYDMSELYKAVRAAGGKVIQAHYSDCWSDEYHHELLAETPALRSNLVVVAAREDTSRLPDATAAQVEATFGRFKPEELKLLLAQLSCGL